MKRGLLLAAIQLALLASVGGKFVYDRAALPRCWVRAAPYDPNLPIRGRYVSLRLQVEPATAAEFKEGWMNQVQLAAENGRLVARRGAAGISPNSVWRGSGGATVLMPPVAFFIPEHVPDPSLRPEGEELWVEVTVPVNGPPRPIRLGVKKNGALTPLALD